MNDKVRKPGDESKVAIDKGFLEKNNVKESMAGLIAQLAANRPADPLRFMAEYFQSNFEQSNRLERCCQMIMLTHHTRPAFRQNLVTAFDILNQTKLAKNLHGINGVVLDELLNLLLREMLPSVVPKVKQILARRHHEAIAYQVFYQTVSSIVIFKDYLHVADQLFDLLDSRSTEQVDKVYAEVIINQLKSTFARLSDRSSQGGLETCFGLSPEGLHSALSKVPHVTGSGRQTLTREQFLEMSADTYLQVLQSHAAQ